MRLPRYARNEKWCKDIIKKFFRNARFSVQFTAANNIVYEISTLKRYGKIEKFGVKLPQLAIHEPYANAKRLPIT